MHESSPRERAFTLIELLAVVAVIATLIGVLLPALGQARAAAWRSVSSEHQRQLHISITTYSQSNDNFIAGAGTSGLRIVNNDKPTALDMSNRDGNFPTGVLDWASPVLDDLPQDREARMWHIWTQFRDPALKIDSTVYAGGDFGTSEAEDYSDERGEAWPGTSYLMPAVWQFYPNKPGLIVPGKPVVQLPYLWDNKEVLLPSNFSPRMDRFGTPSHKIALADGLRAMVDGEVQFDASIFGNPTNLRDPWTSRNAIYNKSSAYGVGSSYQSDEPANLSNGAQVPHSYRHNNQIDAVMWDGHVELFSIEESHDPTLWFPSQSTWVGTDVVQDAKLIYSVGDKLH